MATNEENIQQELISAFGFLDGKVRVQRERRIWVEVPVENFRAVFDHVRQKMGFVILCTITGLDEGDKLGFIYHLARENGILLNIKTVVPKDRPTIRTITDVFPAAEMYEREVEALLGAKVEGLPAGRQYPLPDDWPAGQYPLRKDWKPAGTAPAPAPKEEGK